MQQDRPMFGLETALQGSLEATGDEVDWIISWGLKPEKRQIYNKMKKNEIFIKNFQVIALSYSDFMTFVIAFYLYLS